MIVWEFADMAFYAKAASCGVGGGRPWRRPWPNRWAGNSQLTQFVWHVGPEQLSASTFLLLLLMPSGYYAVFTTIHEERVFPEVGQLVMGTHGILSKYGLGG